MDMPPMRELVESSSDEYSHAAPIVTTSSITSFVGQGSLPVGTARDDENDNIVGKTISPQSKKTPLWKRRKFVVIGSVVTILIIVLVFVLLFPVVRAIAQLIVNRAVLNIDSASITNPYNKSFSLALTGVATHTGIFSGRIAFPNPITVDWLKNGPSDTENKTTLGTMQLQPLTAKNKRATINETGIPFNISDEGAFGSFIGAAITQPNFTWLLTASNLHVNALKFPTAEGIRFSKTLTLNGINNFNGKVKLVNFQSQLLPQGIIFKAVTEMNNSSPFQMNLGTTVYNLTYQSVFLGQATSTQTLIVPSENNITMNIVPNSQVSVQELTALDQWFLGYLSGSSPPIITAKGVSTLQPDGRAISWLSSGFSSLDVNIPF